MLTLHRLPPGLWRWLRQAVPTSWWRLSRRMLARDSAAHRTLATLLAERRRRALSSEVAGTVLPLLRSGTIVWGHPVRRFVSSEVLDEHASEVSRVLSAADVEHLVLPATTNEQHIIVVPESDRGMALAALGAALGPRAWYATTLTPNRPGATHQLGVPSPVSRQDPAGQSCGLRVFRFLVDGAGGNARFLSGAALGCDVQFWPEAAVRNRTDSHETFPEGSLLAPKLRNRWTDVIPADRRCTRAQPLGSGAIVPVLAGLTRPHVFEVEFDIDVVYTWVDGSDPRWQERRLRAAEDAGAIHPLAANESRFASHDELRYSLRSLEMYANWVRHIYVITDGQTPSWLQVDHPRITVVDHTELFDATELPTFNSHAIETRLHHIDGLSEHFLYLNDDVFFGDAIAPELFFLSNGTARFFCSTANIGLDGGRRADTPVVAAGKSNRRLIREAFGATITARLQHTPHALSRSVLADIEERFPAEIERTAARRFRSPEDVSMAASLGHYYGYLTNRAVPAQLRYFYADIARAETPVRLDELLRTRDADVICLNDVATSAPSVENVRRVVGEFLEAYFPFPSSFEKGTS